MLAMRANLDRDRIKKSGKENMNDKELLELAEEIIEQKVFGSWMIREDDMIPSVFMIVALMDKEIFDELLKRNVVAFYEHMSESTSMRVNGYPTFFSCHYISHDELTKLIQMIEKLDAARKESKEGILKSIHVETENTPR